MIDRVVVDTGAIVGALNEKDQHFFEAASRFRELPKPLFTCEAVITEALYLVRRLHNGSERILDLVSTGVVRLEHSLQDEIDSVKKLMKKYESVPMSLADACLIRMSESLDAPIFTFDTDFYIYRRRGRQRIPLVGLDER